MSGGLAGMADLFETTQFPGLNTATEFIPPGEEMQLCQRIDSTRLTPFKFQGWLGKRVTRSYGLGYDFDAGRLEVAEPIPDWLIPVRARAATFAELEPDVLTQALLIRYDPGAGIGWHRDRPYYEHVVGISLGVPATMRFRRRTPQGFERKSVPLAPRSIYHLSGEARHVWEHSIVEMTQTRWSVTFRSLSESGLRALRSARPAPSDIAR